MAEVSDSRDPPFHHRGPDLSSSALSFYVIYGALNFAFTYNTAGFPGSRHLRTSWDQYAPLHQRQEPNPVFVHAADRAFDIRTPEGSTADNDFIHTAVRVPDSANSR